MIDTKKATKSLARLTLLKFFPADPTARAEIVLLVCRMAHTNEQVNWLAERTLGLWNDWEGPRELRAVFCSKFRPADGIEAYSALERFADGIPSETESGPLAIEGGFGVRRIAPPPDERLMAEEITASPSCQKTIAALAIMKDLDRIDRRQPKVPQIPDFPADVNPISQADIDRAVRELRDQRAREEAGLPPADVAKALEALGL